MENIFLFAFIIVLTRTVYSNIMLVITLTWLKNNQNKQLSVRANEAKEFIIVIPVLREQKVLRATLNHFLSVDYDLNKITIFLISTEKEIKEAVGNYSDEQTTIDLIIKLKKEINKKFQREIIVHQHYPLTDGKMVHQINYAFDSILSLYRRNLKNIFVAIYNADSRPNLDTFNIVSSLAKNNNLRVFQQSALFFDNFKIIKSKNNFFTKNYLITNAVLHSRWTLAHEVPRLLRQSFFINHFKKRAFLSHCVGHGLFLRGDFLKQIKTMPSITVTEDLFFGYILSLLGESINPVPVLENAEAPATLLSALKQKYVWFFGPLDHFSYEKFVKNNFSDKVNPLILKWFTLQGIIPALAWFFMGWLFLFVLLYPLTSHNYWLFLSSILLFMFYGPLSYCLVLLTGKKMNKLLDVEYLDYFWLILFSFPVIFIHGLPPIFTLLAKINYFFTNKEPIKPKTEH